MDSYDLHIYEREKTLISSVLLCAGRSSRMRQEKAFLKIAGESAITRILNHLCPISELVVVVVSPNNFKAVKEHLIDSYLQLFNVHFAINENAEKGMFTSIQKGLDCAIKEKPTLLHYIDQPFIREEIYDDLIDILDNDHQIFQPSVKIEGKYRAGHPLIFNPQFRDYLLSFPDHANLQQIINQPQIKRKFLCVSDASVLHNINTKEELIKLKEKFEE